MRTRRPDIAVNDPACRHPLEADLQDGPPHLCPTVDVKADLMLRKLAALPPLSRLNPSVFPSIGEHVVGIRAFILQLRPLKRAVWGSIRDDCPTEKVWATPTPRKT